MFLRIKDSIGRSLSGIYNPLTGVGSDQDTAKSYEIKTTRRKLTEFEVAALYRDSGMLQRVIDLPVDLACECELKLKSANEDEDLADILDALNETWDWQTLFREASISARIFKEAYLVLDIDDGLDASEPVDLDKVKGLNNIFFVEFVRLMPIWANNRLDRIGYRLINAIKYPNDANDIASKLPEFTVIHPDRVILFCGSKLSPKQQQLNSGYHNSVVETVADSYLSLVGAYNSANNFLAKLVTFVFKMKGLKNLILQGAESAIQDRLRTHKYGIGSVGGVVIDSDNEEIDWLTVPLTGLPETLSKVERFFQANVDIPHDMLWNEGSNNTASDLESINTQRAIKRFLQRYWLGNIQQLVNVVAREFTDQPIFAELSLPEPDLDLLDVQNAKFVQAQTDQIYNKLGILSSKTILANRFGDNPFEIAEETLNDEVEDPIPQPGINGAFATASNANADPNNADQPNVNPGDGNLNQEGLPDSQLMETEDPEVTRASNKKNQETQPKKTKATGDSREVLDAKHFGKIEKITAADLERIITNLKATNPTIYSFAVAEEDVEPASK